MERSGLWIQDGNKFPDTRSVEIKSVPFSERYLLDYPEGEKETRCYAAVQIRDMVQR